MLWASLSAHAPGVAAVPPPPPWKQMGLYRREFRLQILCKILFASKLSKLNIFFQIPERITSIVADGRKEPRMKRSSVKKSLQQEQNVQVVIDDQNHPPQVSSAEQICMEVVPHKNSEGHQEFVVG